MNWEIASGKHIGGREEQQDSVATFSSPNGEVHLLIVADGMGGHNAGGEASQIVIRTAQSVWNKYQQGYMVTAPLKFLLQICEKAHYGINELGKKYEMSSRSTCVFLYINNKKVWWLHVGDSRLYHFRGKKLLRRTKDHSVVQLLVDLGRIEEEDMAKHPDQNRLFKGLGSDEVLNPDVGQVSVRPGDSLLLCSDGFWEYVSPKKMSEKLLQTELPIKKRIKNLLKETLDAGGIKGDNIAIAVAQLPTKKRLNIGNAWHFLKSLIISLPFVEKLPSSNTAGQTHHCHLR